MSTPVSPKINGEENPFYFRLDTEFSQNQKSVLVPFIHNSISQELSHIKESFKKKLIFFDNKITSSIKEVENKIRTILDKNNHLFEQISTFKVKSEKIDHLEKTVYNNNEHIIDNDVRICSLRKDLDNACYKYDKIYLNNLIVSGQIGDYCKYKNLKEFLEYAINKLNQFELFKEKQEMVFKEYKMSSETKINNLTKLVDSFFVTNVNYIDMKLKELKNTIDSDINLIKDKFPNIQVDYENQITKIKDLLIEENHIIKNEIEKEIDITSRNLISKINKTNSNFRTHRKEYSQVKAACLNIAELLKNNRFNKSLINNSNDKSPSPSHINYLANEIINSLTNDKNNKKIKKKSNNYIERDNSKRKTIEIKQHIKEYSTPMHKKFNSEKNSDFKIPLNRKIHSTNNLINFTNSLSKKASSNLVLEINNSNSSDENEDSSEIYESITSLSKIRKSFEETSKKEEDVKVNNNTNTNNYNYNYINNTNNTNNNTNTNNYNNINNTNNNTNSNNNEGNEKKKDEIIEHLIFTNQQTIKTIKEESDEKMIKLEQKINELITNNDSLKQKVKDLEKEKKDNFNKLVIRKDDENQNQKPKISVPKFHNGRGFPPSKIRKKNLIKKQSLSQVQSHTIDEPMFGLQSNDFNFEKKIKSQEKKKTHKTYYVSKLFKNNKKNNEESELIKNLSIKFLKPLRNNLVNVPQLNLKNKNS